MNCDCESSSECCEDFSQLNSSMTNPSNLFNNFSLNTSSGNIDIQTINWTNETMNTSPEYQNVVVSFEISVFDDEHKLIANNIKSVSNSTTLNNPSNNIINSNVRMYLISFDKNQTINLTTNQTTNLTSNQFNTPSIIDITKNNVLSVSTGTTLTLMGSTTKASGLIEVNSNGLPTNRINRSPTVNLRHTVTLMTPQTVNLIEPVSGARTTINVRATSSSLPTNIASNSPIGPRYTSGHTSTVIKTRNGIFKLLSSQYFQHNVNNIYSYYSNYIFDELDSDFQIDLTNDNKILMVVVTAAHNGTVPLSMRGVSRSNVPDATLIYKA